MATTSNLSLTKPDEGDTKWASEVNDNWNKIDASVDYIKVSDVKSNGTHGGTFTSGAWQTRDINTEDADTGGHCSISSNQITLAAGTYRCYIRCPAHRIGGNHKARLQNITDVATEILGSNAMGPDVGSDGGAGEGDSVIQGRFTIATSKTLEIQDRCQATRATDGFGRACSFGVSEIYTVAEFWKIA